MNATQLTATVIAKSESGRECYRRVLSGYLSVDGFKLAVKSSVEFFEKSGFVVSVEGA